MSTDLPPSGAFAASWKEYLEAVYHDGIYEKQRREAQQAFYAGALAAFGSFSTAALLPHAAALEMFDRLLRELGAFGAEAISKAKEQQK